MTIRPISVVRMATRLGTVFQVVVQIRVEPDPRARRRSAAAAAAALPASSRVEAVDDRRGIAGDDLGGVRAPAVEEQLHRGRLARPPACARNPAWMCTTISTLRESIAGRDLGPRRRR